MTQRSPRNDRHGLRAALGLGEAAAMLAGAGLAAIAAWLADATPALIVSAAIIGTVIGKFGHRAAQRRRAP